MVNDQRLYDLYVLFYFFFPFTFAFFFFFFFYVLD